MYQGPEHIHLCYEEQVEDIGIYLCTMEQSVENSSKQMIKKQTDREQDLKLASENQNSRKIILQMRRMKIKEKKEKNKKFPVKKSFGRWRYKEHYIYIQALREGLNQKQLFKHLEIHLPSRTNTQIRAHHQKMMCKFKGVDSMLKAYPSHQIARQYMRISEILDQAMLITRKITQNIPKVLSLPSYYKNKL